MKTVFEDSDVEYTGIANKMEEDDSVKRRDKSFAYRVGCQKTNQPKECINTNKQEMIEYKTNVSKIMSLSLILK